MNIRYSKVREQIACKDCGLIFEPLEPELAERFERASGLSKAKPKKKKTAKKKAVKKKKRK